MGAEGTEGGVRSCGTGTPQPRCPHPSNPVTTQPPAPHNLSAISDSTSHPPHHSTCPNSQTVKQLPPARRPLNQKTWQVPALRNLSGLPCVQQLSAHPLNALNRRARARRVLTPQSQTTQPATHSLSAISDSGFHPPRHSTCPNSQTVAIAQATTGVTPSIQARSAYLLDSFRVLLSGARLGRTWAAAPRLGRGMNRIDPAVLHVAPGLADP